MAERDRRAAVRRAERAVQSTNAAFSSQMNSMNATIERLHDRLERKIQECRNDTAEGGVLLTRARRLNQRLEVLKNKLKISFQVSGEEEPDNLQITLQQMANVDPEGAPPEYVCPITQCLMVDPVMTSDGQIYDRCSISEWFAGFSGGRAPRSPLTNLPLENRGLTPMPDLAARISLYLKEQSGMAVPSATAEEPSLRHLPLSVRDSANANTADQTAEQTEAKSKPRSSGPIWSSSVVPASEQDSRVLNLLRVDDTLPLPSEDNPPLRPPAGVRGQSVPTTRRGAPEAARQPVVGTNANAPAAGAGGKTATRRTTTFASRHTEAVTAARRTTATSSSSATPITESAPTHAPPPPSTATATAAPPARGSLYQLPSRRGVSATRPTPQYTVVSTSNPPASRPTAASTSSKSAVRAPVPREPTAPAPLRVPGPLRQVASDVRARVANQAARSPIPRRTSTQGNAGE